MPKPSIFSKEYEKHMRKRRIKIILAIVCLFIVGVSIFAGGSLKSLLKNKINLQTNKNSTQSSENKTAQGKITEDKTTTNAENNVGKDTPQSESQDKSYDVKLSNGVIVKAVYEQKEGTKKFKYIDTTDASITFDVNSSGIGMIIFDSKAQSIYFLDINGKYEDITKKNYTTRSTHKTYSRESILKRRSDYVWCAEPKFIDDENIAYFSNLPYIGGSTKKYLWSVNVKNKDRHIYKITVKGENLKFGSLTENGLQVILDDNSIKNIKISGHSIVVSK